VDEGAIALGPSGQVYLAGATNSPNFPRQTGESGTGAFAVALNLENASTALSFVPVTPCRIADTRNMPDGPFAGPIIAGNSTRDFIIPNSSCGIPETAAAYSLNVTVDPHGQRMNYLTIWPTGTSQPLASTLNSTDGRVKANAAIVPAGAGGGVTVYVSNTTDVILDIDGYFVSTSSSPSALAFYPLTPCRVLDTRNADGPLGGPNMTAGSTREFAVLSSSCNIPASAQAYSLNFSVGPLVSDFRYLTTWPAGAASQPLVSTLNAVTGTITANAAIVPAGTSGEINVYVTDPTQLWVDIDGYFAPPGAGGLSLYNLQPCRVLDTRQPPGSQPFSGTINVNVLGSNCGAPASAQAYVLNATVDPPGQLNYLTLWPEGETQPVVSTLNALDGFYTSNLAIVPTNNGSISAYAYSPTHLILDIFGYFAP
jgi:hypothetical protein